MTEASRIGVFVVQASHGFSRGDPVRFDGTNWVLAAGGGSGTGIVGSINDSNTFEFVTHGELENLVSLVPGSTYYSDTDGVLTTIPNGVSVGYTLSDTKLFVQMGASGSTSGTIDTSNLATNTALLAAIAAEIVRANAAYSGISHDHDGRYIHSVSHDGVISVDIVAPGPIFDESDGTQVLVG